MVTFETDSGFKHAAEFASTLMFEEDVVYIRFEDANMSFFDIVNTFKHIEKLTVYVRDTDTVLTTIDGPMECIGVDKNGDRYAIRLRILNYKKPESVEEVATDTDIKE